MNARRDSSDEPESGSSAGRALLVGAVVFAAVATGVLVLSDEQRFLRLGIIAALWAALVGAFLAAKYRRALAEQQAAAADRQEIYELELEREIAARREYELEVVAEAKRQAEEESRDDIAALRGELQNIRQTLEGLLGGEFLVERYALHAESTRMRSLGEDRALVRNDLKRLPAAQAKAPDVVPAVVRDAETELIERIREVHHQPRREPQPARPEPRQEPRPEGRVDPRPTTPPRPTERPARAQRSAPEPQKPTQQKPTPPKPPTPPPVKPAAPAQPPQRPPRREQVPPERPAEVSDRWFIPEGLGQPESAAPPRRAPAAAGWQQEAPEQEWAPSWESNEPAGRRSRHTPEPTEVSMPPVEPLQQPNRAPAAHDPSMQLGMTAEQTNWLAQYNRPADQDSSYTIRAYVPPIRAEQPAPPEPRRTERPSRRGLEETEYSGGHRADQSEEAPGGRRRRPEPEEPQDTGGGGRRRRAEGQPSWQETVAHRAESEEPTGSHAAGRSVNELLANHGIEGSPRRRRRRED